MSTRLRRKEMAKELGVEVRTLDRWRKKGLYGVKLSCKVIGRTVGFTWGDIEAFRRQVDKRRGRLKTPRAMPKEPFKQAATV